MIRTLLYLVAGVLLGLIIHLVVILLIPQFATRDVYSVISQLDALNQPRILTVPGANQPNPLRLDPDFVYAVCEIDLADGPGVVSGPLPEAFWSVAVFNDNGTVIYSTTNRDGIGATLELGIFNRDQTRLLASQQIDIAEGLLIVESPVDSLFVVVRLSPPHPIMRPRYQEALAGLTCGNLE